MAILLRWIFVGRQFYENILPLLKISHRNESNFSKFYNRRIIYSEEINFTIVLLR